VLHTKIVHLGVQRTLIRDHVMRRQIIEHYRHYVEPATVAMANVGFREPFI